MIEMARVRCLRCFLVALLAAGLVQTFVASPRDAAASRRGTHRPPRTLRRVDGAEVDATEAEDEVQVWKDAYQLELERADLLDEQLKVGLDRLGELSTGLREEFEGCLLDLEKVPEKPADSEAAKWSEAYMGIRHCNEQLELKITEIREKISQKEDEKSGDYYGWTSTMDLDPIKYKGIKFTDIQLDRYNREKGSSFYFLELQMPLGLQLEEVEVDGVGTVIQVTEIVDGGSAKEDKSIRVGDYLRAVTTPQRKLSGEEGEEGDITETFGASAGEQTKAVLVIPRGFPFQRVMDEISENKKLDGYAGLVFERPFVEDE